MSQMGSWGKRVLLGLLAGCLAFEAANASDGDKQATFRVINSANRRVTMQVGEVNMLRQWVSEPPRRSLKAGETYETKVACATRYCLHSKRALNADENAPTVIEFFSKQRGEYVTTVAAYGVTLVASSLMADRYAPVIMEMIPESVNEWSFEYVGQALQTVNRALRNTKDRVADPVLRTILEVMLDTVIPEVGSQDEERLEQTLKAGLVSVLVQKAVIEMGLAAVRDYGPAWLEEMIDDNSGLVSALTSVGGLYMSQQVWQNLAPKYTSFLRAHPVLIGKKVLLAGIGYYAYYHNQTSETASLYFTTLDANAFADGQEELVEVLISNYGDRTISLSQL